MFLLFENGEILYVKDFSDEDIEIGEGYEISFEDDCSKNLRLIATGKDIDDLDFYCDFCDKEIGLERLVEIILNNEREYVCEICFKGDGIVN